MADYINRDSVIELSREYYSQGLKEEAVPVRAIKNIPSADVAEVVHGIWLWELADNGWADHICSKCGYAINTDVHVIVDYKYCPNCGADMRMDGGT